MLHVLAKYGGITFISSDRIIIVAFYPRPWEPKILLKPARTMMFGRCGAISQIMGIKQVF